MINENIIKGKWSQVKGQIQAAWGKLTDDELEETRGDVHKITGLVQQKYGETQEKVRTRLNTFLADIGDKEEFEDSQDYKSPANKDHI